MISGQALLVVIVVAATLWLGGELVSGVKHVGHNLKCKVHHTEACELPK